MLKRTEILSSKKERESSLAIIDLGSNSLRLVIYDALVRGRTILYEEKVSCGLGKNVNHTKLLETEIIDQALLILQRFIGICHNFSVSTVQILATAATRIAENGQEFVSLIREKVAENVRILSGEEEAHYAALGVISSFCKPQGMVADLGGGSLEIIAIDANQPTKGISYPLGGLILKDAAQNNLLKAKKIVRSCLEEDYSFLQALGEDFYAIGGTWRNLARLHMQYENYPPSVLHGYAVDAMRMSQFLEELIIDFGTTGKKLDLSNVAKKRRSLLPYGAIVLLELISKLEPKRIIFSGAGIRDGYFFSCLDEAEKRKDGFLCSIEKHAAKFNKFPDYIYSLLQWVDKSFKNLHIEETEEEIKCRKAVCLLANIGWNYDALYRAKQVAQQIIYTDFSGAVSHSDRIYIAYSLFLANGGANLMRKRMPHFSERFLSKQSKKRARLLAEFIQLAENFSAFSEKKLPLLRWKRTKKSVQLFIPKGEKLNAAFEENLQKISRNLSVDVKQELY